MHCAVASGLGNARQLLHSLQRREVHYEFVEIMACPGGCAGGGGQPVDGTDREKAADRGKVLFRLDQNAPLRFSHENPAVQALYREYLDEPWLAQSGGIAALRPFRMADERFPLRHKRITTYGFYPLVNLPFPF